MAEVIFCIILFRVHLLSSDYCFVKFLHVLLSYQSVPRRPIRSRICVLSMYIHYMCMYEPVRSATCKLYVCKIDLRILRACAILCRDELEVANILLFAVSQVHMHFSVRILMSEFSRRRLKKSRDLYLLCE